jgi:hypothetical protein
MLAAAMDYAKPAGDVAASRRKATTMLRDYGTETYAPHPPVVMKRAQARKARPPESYGEAALLEMP